MSSPTEARPISRDELERKLEALQRQLSLWFWLFASGVAGVFIALGGALAHLWSDAQAIGGAVLAAAVAGVGITLLERRHDRIAIGLGLACPACQTVFVERGESKLRAGRCRCGYQVAMRSERLARPATPAVGGLPTLERLESRARGYRVAELGLHAAGFLGGAAIIGGAVRLQLGVGRSILYVAPLVVAFLYGWWLLAGRLPRWFGVTCPACETLLIGNRGEPILGATSETKECRECGAAVAV